MRISIIGNGKVAQALAIRLQESRQELVEMFSQNQNKLTQFCSRKSITPLNDIRKLNRNIDLLIIAINDDAIEKVSKEIQGNFLVVHTSGSVPMEVLNTQNIPNFGVLYPLFSFSKHQKIDFREIPFLVEANTKKNQSLLLEIANAISDSVHICKSDLRFKYHLMAVFVNNFVNHIWGQAQASSQEMGLKFDLLKPILMQTAQKAVSSPNILELQTGPAIRNDKLIINKHLKKLESLPEMQNLYQILTQMIQNTQGQQKNTKS